MTTVKDHQVIASRERKEMRKNDETSFLKLRYPLYRPIAFNMTKNKLMTKIRAPSDVADTTLRIVRLEKAGSSTDRPRPMLAMLRS